MNALQKRMVGHGAIIMLIGLIAGIGLVMKLIGGFEIFPNYIVQFELFGSDRGWARAHAGGLMNGLMIFVVALLLWGLNAPERLEKKLFWMIVGAGYGNTMFYWGGMLSASRALTFGDNRLGETNIWGILGLVPALVFSFVSLYSFYVLARHAFSEAKS
ncbi:hypothetical protein A3715_12050 [Oleiphilus sp. HI0009]|uniref:styrene-oxide isomerase StyC n=1 Tax=unclassified Oleiphilus TaxID=2631174 RepID=UPI0007C26DCF|nr:MULTISPECIES: hypothetical protein [unclassified Oleiphilus]KZX77023.1 hypothetical protein A3715_12050 [Oleiphilus sp. HI0009]MCH2159220.1 hypothetical protein [Oleiphilaceae bacterium]KZY68765.1 hypothetical protein A3739_20065 [Oleiphilus sp. HI0067]KZY69034.1 hypothetical protein A3739_09760 [Oleiphilus sp. HI0067]KZY69233.1 hypothetical protein A3738_26015 [Oleiphilus sp. HI0066]